MRAGLHKQVPIRAVRAAAAVAADRVGVAVVADRAGVAVAADRAGVDVVVNRAGVAVADGEWPKGQAGYAWCDASGAIWRMFMP